MVHWGTGAGNNINQSYHISYRRYPEPLVLAKRNAGSGYEIVNSRYQLCSIEWMSICSVLQNIEHDLQIYINDLPYNI